MSKRRPRTAAALASRLLASLIARSSNTQRWYTRVSYVCTFLMCCMCNYASLHENSHACRHGNFGATPPPAKNPASARKLPAPARIPPDPSAARWGRGAARSARAKFSQRDPSEQRARSGVRSALWLSSARSSARTRERARLSCDVGHVAYRFVVGQQQACGLAMGELVEAIQLCRRLCRQALYEIRTLLLYSIALDRAHCNGGRARLESIGEVQTNRETALFMNTVRAQTMPSKGHL